MPAPSGGILSRTALVPLSSQGHIHGRHASLGEESSSKDGGAVHSQACKDMSSNDHTEARGWKHEVSIECAKSDEAG